MFLIVKDSPLRPASCLVRDCLALKWLKPGFLAMILPFLVTFNLLVNDLLVFINLFAAFYGNSDALGAALVGLGNLVILGQEMQHAIQSLL